MIDFFSQFFVEQFAMPIDTDFNHVLFEANIGLGQGTMEKFDAFEIVSFDNLADKPFILDTFNAVEHELLQIIGWYGFFMITTGAKPVMRTDFNRVSYRAYKVRVGAAALNGDKVSVAMVMALTESFSVFSKRFDLLMVIAKEAKGLIPKYVRELRDLKERLQETKMKLHLTEMELKRVKEVLNGKD